MHNLRQLPRHDAAPLSRSPHAPILRCLTSAYSRWRTLSRLPKTSFISLERRCAMKYNKQTLSKLTPEEIQDISYSKLMKGTIWSSVNMLVCALQWLLKAYKLRYIFIAVSAILIPYLVVLIVRLIRLDKDYEASLKA